MLLKTEAVAEERDRVTAQLERIQIHNAALLDVINRFQERMQAAGQDDQALRNELHEMVSCKFCFKFLSLCVEYSKHTFNL